MVNYWKSLIPKFKKVFEKNGPKKAAAAEATKAFDEAKEEYSKEFEETKTELQPKVIEIYEASSTELKGLIKTPNDSGLKKHSAAVQKFLDELVKIEFPGSKAVSEASSKLGPAYVSGPVSFVFEKVSTFIVVEEKKEEPAAAAAAEAETTTGAAAPAEAETSTTTTTEEVKEKEIVIEEEKKEEAPPPPPEAAEKTEAPAPAAAAELPAPAAEPPKA
ncbi:hypothetical protein M9H77_36350 [Catharanthus roseus]|uniref:Uncharacterized protein n=1 Tax=Catharanthus roseus TaxID=4058 RepID=A0ACB9ZRY1_CATRO|nr:hypothetical protein M9H77_36350 [Catharanthus roseus]